MAFPPVRKYDSLFGYIKKFMRNPTMQQSYPKKFTRLKKAYSRWRRDKRIRKR